METNPLAVLTAPIRKDEIEWRIQNAKNGKMTIVPYVTSRCVQERFDQQFGWNNWETSFEEVDGGFLCTITVTSQGHRISKTDGASRTNIEPVKGGISDALKRTAVQFGLGRDLYRYPKVIIMTTEEKYIPNAAYAHLNALVDTLAAEETLPGPHFIRLDDSTKSSTSGSAQPESNTQGASTDNKLWLNMTTKDGQVTAEWEKIVKAIGQGYKLSDFQKKYKINKEVQAEIKRLTGE